MNYKLAAVFLWLCIVLISACKDPEEMGLEVQPASDQLSVLHTDTTTLFTRTVKEDSLRSNGVAYQLLGSYTDPVFGKSDAGFYAQVSLALTPVLGNVLTPDSLILSLGYAGTYGDFKSSVMMAHVYRLSEDMLVDSAYYTNKIFQYDALSDLANGHVFLFRPNDSVSVASVMEPPQLRIPLSLALASELLSLNGQAAFADNPSWLRYFKGLYVKAETQQGSGAISYFDLYNNPYSKLTLYYKQVTTAGDTISSHYDFNLAPGVKVNRQEHAYNGSSTSVGHQLIDSTYNDSWNYIQSMAGVKTKITFPYLKHFIDSGNIVVNKAELEITVQPGSGDIFAPPAKLFLAAIDSTGKSTFLTDYFEGASYFGGSYNSTGTTYKFNMARQLQRILDGKIGDFGFYLLVSGSVVQAGRVVIGSGKNPDSAMKLHLFYTKLH